MSCEILTILVQFFGQIKTFYRNNTPFMQICGVKKNKTRNPVSAETDIFCCLQMLRKAVSVLEGHLNFISSLSKKYSNFDDFFFFGGGGVIIPD